MSTNEETKNISLLRSGRKRTYQSFRESISGSLKKIVKKPKFNETFDGTGKSNESTFKYGNYNRYYGYRNENKQEDKRLSVLKKEWFENKSILDIGSNVGHVSLWIGKNFQPEKIKGVDIDTNLVKVARKNIVHYIDENYVSSLEQSFNTDVENSKEDANKSAIITKVKEGQDTSSNSENLAPNEESSVITLNEEILPKSVEQIDETIEEKSKNDESNPVEKLIEDEEKLSKKDIGQKLMERLNKNEKVKKDNVFPYNVSFILENYVPAGSQVLNYTKQEFHVILCLSVTKWVQLNFGDSGLKLMFKKIYKQLYPGGKLILEPQPYKSYKRRKNLTPEIRQNYDSMKLMPDQFVEYLLSEEVGFLKCEQIDVMSHDKQGFQRPMYILTKAQ